MKEGKQDEDAVKNKPTPAPATTTASKATTSTGIKDSEVVTAATVMRDRKEAPAAAPAAADGRSNTVSGRKVEKKPEPEPPFRPRVTLPANMEPTFFIGGGNGVNILDETLSGLGWRRTKDKTDDNVKLKWTELKSQINYNKFREGEQIVNHIPNCNLLTNKLGLLNTLQDYAKACAARARGPKLDFIPETYRLDDAKDRELFLDTWQDGEVWICKPTGKNQGKGIFLVRNMDEVTRMVQDQEDKRDDGRPVRPLNRVIQRYIHNPLLIEGKKFDIRCYMLVASCVPYLVLYHPGYVRLSMVDYDNDSDNLVAHLTNQYIQKKDPSYQEKKEDTAWTWERFNTYLNDTVTAEKGIPMDWLYSVFDSRAKAILQYVFNSVKHKLARRMGYFDLYGIDFMIDDNMKVWLIEVNVNPTLAINCEALKDCIPPIVRETLYIAVECFEKSRKNRPLLPLSSQKRFEIIHNGCTKPRSQGPSPMRGYSSVEKRSYSASPVRRYQSPLKESPGEKTAPPRAPFAKNTLRSTTTTSQDAGKITMVGRGSKSGAALYKPSSSSMKAKEQPKLTDGKDTEVKSKDDGSDDKSSKEDATDEKESVEVEDKSDKEKVANAARKDRYGIKTKPVLLSLSKMHNGVATYGRSFMGRDFAKSKAEKKDTKKDPSSKPEHTAPKVDPSPKPEHTAPKVDPSPKPEHNIQPKVDKKEMSPKAEKKIEAKGKADTKVDKKAVLSKDSDKKDGKKESGKVNQGIKSKDEKQKFKDDAKAPKSIRRPGDDKHDAVSEKLENVKTPVKDNKKEKSRVNIDVKTDKKEVPKEESKVGKSDVQKSDSSKEVKKTAAVKAKESSKPAPKMQNDNTNTNNSSDNTTDAHGQSIPAAATAGAQDDAIPHPTIHFAPPNLSQADKKALKLHLDPPKIKSAKRTKSPYVASKPATMKHCISHHHDKGPTKMPNGRSTLVEDNRGS